jgi:hypothetical protein
MEILLNMTFIISLIADRRETRDYHIISMAIPLVIENLLPCKLEYQLYDRKTGTEPFSISTFSQQYIVIVRYELLQIYRND